MQAGRERIPARFCMKIAEILDFLRSEHVCLCDNSSAEWYMFNDLFDFKKQRTLKESIGFYLFYACIIMGVQGFMMMFGV
jgi:hypothetical protein